MTQKSILLVEDNDDDIALTLRAFKKTNIVNAIAIARDGQEAIDYLVGGKDREGNPVGVPSVVLLDLNLPKIGGLDVLRRVRAQERTKLLPVVILTSSREEQDLINGYSLGANSYVCKPVDFNHFAEAVNRLGLYWLLVNELPPPHVTGDRR